MPDLRFALLTLRGARLRLGLVVVAVGLAAAAVCTVDILNRAVLRAFVEVIDTMTGRAALQVNAGGVGLFQEAMVDAIERVAGVDIAVPVMSATVWTGDGSGAVTVLGADLRSDRRLGAYLAEPYGPRTARELYDELLALDTQMRAVVLPTQFAARRDLHVGDWLQLETPAGQRAFQVRGIVDLDSVGRAVGGEIILMHLPAAQADFGRTRFVNRADIVLRPGADIETVRTAIMARLPPGLTVSTPLQRQMDLRRVIRSQEIILWAVAVVAVLLSALVAFDTLATHFETQTWQAGVLRAVGVRTPAVWTEFLKQGLLLGAAGVAIGVPAGIANGAYFVPIIAASAAVHYKVTAPAGEAAISPWSIAIAAAVGLSAGVLCAVLPAWRAAHVSIATVIGHRGREMAPLDPRLSGWIGAGAVAAALAAAWFAHTSVAMSLAATALILIAVVLVARPLLALAVPVLGRLLDRYLGPVGAFACAGVLRGIRRTSLAVAVVAAGIGSVLWIRTVAASFEHSLAAALSGSLRADLIVASTRVVSGWVPAPMRAESIAAVAAVSGVRVAAGNRLADWTHAGRSIAINALDAPYFRSGVFEKPPLIGPHPGDAWDAVGRGAGVIASTNFLMNFGHRVGDVIEISTPSGKLALPIVGATLAFISPGGTIEMSRELYVQHWHDADVNRVWVRAEDGTDRSSLQAAITQALGRSLDVRALSAREMQTHLVERAQRAFAPVAILEGVIFLIVLLSVGDALTAGVVQRVREIGTSRALGMRRRGIVGTLITEGMLIGVVGLGLAILAGLALGSVWVHGTLPVLLGWQVAFSFPAERALTFAGATMVTCLLAAALPAWQAARLEPATALRYE